MNVGITTIGIYVPEKILTNHDLAKIVDTNDEWITTRTGIKKRHIAADNETATDMGFIASQRALEKAGIDPKEIDLIVCSTGTPDFRFPSVAALIQYRLGIPNIPAFDMSPACGGFIYILAAAEAYIKSGFAKKVLCVCTEKMSSIIDWTDRNTCILFGDAAAAFVVEVDSPTNTIVKTIFGGDGAYADLLRTEQVGENTFLRMDGTGVFKQAVRIMDEQVRLVCETVGKSIDDIDLLVPHQANARIIAAIGERLGLPSEKAFVNVHAYGNTSSATIPLALFEAEEQGLIKSGSLVATVALGGGFTWGAALIQF